MNKATLSSIALFAFCLFSIANLVDQVTNIDWLERVTKPLLMTTLAVYYLSTNKGTVSKFIVFALAFSWIGDMLLMLQGQYDDVFLYGLFAFLVANICYIIGFNNAKWTSSEATNKPFVRTRIIFLIAMGFMIIYLLYPALGEMRIPVMIYTIVIISMGISALLRRGKTTNQSFILVYSGSLLFILSDAMIGINKFLSPIAYGALLVMATYIGAQFLIIKGILMHDKASFENKQSA